MFRILRMVRSSLRGELLLLVFWGDGSTRGRHVGVVLVRLHTDLRSRGDDVS